jgi:hypothetical protein
MSGNGYSHRLACDGLDIIGDVHGCALSLRALLAELDYREQDGVFFHPNRKLVFLGDVVDRGPRIREALALIRASVEQGHAFCILGNHEFNALAYTWPIRDSDTANSQDLRPHNQRNNRLIAETLTQFASYPESWRDYLQWFKTLPLYLDFGDVRMVHACWHEDKINSLNPEGTSKVCVDDDVLSRIENGDRELEITIDVLTRGTSIRLPNSRVMQGRDGLQRNFFRTKFWAKDPEVYQDVVFQPDPLPEDLVARRLNAKELQELLFYSEKEAPLFFGHYWLHGKPRLQAKNLACLDYSAVKYGRLVAYRFDGERELQADKFRWIYVDPDSDTLN